MENVVTPPTSPDTSEIDSDGSTSTTASEMDSDGSTSTTASEQLLSEVAPDDAHLEGAIEYNRKKLKQEKRKYNRLLAKCTPAKIGAELAAEIQAEFSYMVNESSSESESEAENPSDILPSPAGYNKLPDHDEDPPSTGITVVSRSLVCSR